MKTHLRSLFAIMLFFGVFTTLAQTGEISGKVTADGVPVPFASVGLAGTTKGASSDESGLYRISQLPAGTCVGSRLHTRLTASGSYFK